MFKKIILDGETTRWSINENGKVRNDETGKFLTGTILHTYRYINFRWNGKQKNKAVHRLVAETFLPNPENLPYVHHIDGNRLNNKLENLMWVSESDNTILAKAPKAKEKHFQGELEGEEWRYFRNTIYQVSNKGRIKNTKTCKISYGTKIDSGYMNLSFVNYEVVSLVEDIILSIVPYVESKNINVLFDTYIEELEIRCDPESIERVILNLLSNAVKFTNNNGNIFVLMDADDKYVTIRIKDDGVGISEEVQEEIFKRFVQEDKSFNRKKEGSGIGLALVKSLVELHDGQVYLEKGIQKGSEFVVNSGKLPKLSWQ